MSAPAHRVVMVGFDDAQILDITGPLEVFSRAARWLRDTAVTADLPYAVELVGKQAGPLRCSSGIELLAQRGYADVDDADTVLVAGGIGYVKAMQDAALIEWLRAQAARKKRIASVCTGAFLLAAAGLLANRSATTHWAYCEKLRAVDPRIDVNPDAIFVSDGSITTSGGVTAGMDMSLALVESDWGQPVALAVAQELVMYLKRPGGQSQFSRHLAAQRSENERMSELQVWILENPDADMSIEALAQRMSMSTRNFTRRFTQELGTTPSRYVLESRVEAARRRLEQSALPIEKIAQRCGFGNAEALRRAFIKVLSVSPGDYRARFQAREPAARKT
jgi:transcriptional regulator GlxA family with amidase domain